MPTKINDRLFSWASDIEQETIRQAEKAARLPIVEGHIALMPDAHLGKGATVGSVIPTLGAIIPAAVGVDIGCGMIAVRTEYVVSDLIGCEVPGLGYVERVLAGPSCDVLEVGTDGVLVPLVRDAVRRVDLNARIIEVDTDFLGL